MTRRRPLLWSGVVLLAAGLVVLGYVGWQLYGTTVVSKHRQAATVERLEQEWPAPAATQPDPEPEPSEAFAIVRIPRFGEEYAVPVIEGIGDDDLSAGFGHFPESAMPGGDGNFALAGHRVTHGEPLRDIDALRPGDVVTVETARATYTYEIDTDPDDLEVDHDAAWVVAPRPENPVAGGAGPADSARVLTLVTCAELFHTDERTVVFGHLVATARK